MYLEYKSSFAFLTCIYIYVYIQLYTCCVTLWSCFTNYLILFSTCSDVNKTVFLVTLVSILHFTGKKTPEEF